ncbi:hypothetical protein PM8797T_09139 [Gimesia maris DSM 8797]|nr:hypothetical protein PM8797T_09139 [Gimesia maris DSM 8797]|tara:strand:+ start:272622 stop:272756 length:135 start_codon:yes stop_codon:yes gene_type:complete
MSVKNYFSSGLDKWFVRAVNEKLMKLADLPVKTKLTPLLLIDQW